MNGWMDVVVWYKTKVVKIHINSCPAPRRPPNHVCHPGECVSRLASGPSLHKASFLLIDGTDAGANTRRPHFCTCECVRWRSTAVYPANRWQLVLLVQRTNKRARRTEKRWRGERKALTLCFMEATSQKQWGRTEGRRWERQGSDKRLVEVWREEDRDDQPGDAS